MDLSKLPRLSGTELQPPSTQAAPSPPAQMPTQLAPAPPSIARKNVYTLGPELWISLIVGLLLIGVSRHFIVYVFDQATGRVYHTGFTFTSDGTEVPYPQLEGFVMLTDAAIFAFGVAMLCDAILRAFSMVLSPTGRRVAMTLAFVLTICATLLNAYVAIKLLHADIMPLISGLAVAFGGYMAFEQSRAARSL